MPCPSAWRWSRPAASRIGQQRLPRERSTRPGTANSSRAGRANDRDALLSYTDAEIYKNGGQGGFEIRTFIAAAAAAKGAKGTIDFCEPIPIFAVSCTTARMQLGA
jgi:hypothetical protein